MLLTLTGNQRELRTKHPVELVDVVSLHRKAATMSWAIFGKGCHQNETLRTDYALDLLDVLSA